MTALRITDTGLSVNCDMASDVNSSYKESTQTLLSQQMDPFHHDEDIESIPIINSSNRYLRIQRGSGVSLAYDKGAGISSISIRGSLCITPPTVYRQN